MSISSPDGKDPLPSFPDGRHHPFSILSPAPGYLPVQHRLCGDAIIPEKKKKKLKSRYFTEIFSELHMLPAHSHLLPDGQDTFPAGMGNCLTF